VWRASAVGGLLLHMVLVDWVEEKLLERFLFVFARWICFPAAPPLSVHAVFLPQQQFDQCDQVEEER
jgi:hypothetical protein